MQHSTTKSWVDTKELLLVVVVIVCEAATSQLFSTNQLLMSRVWWMEMVIVLQTLDNMLNMLNMLTAANYL